MNPRVGFKTSRGLALATRSARGDETGSTRAPHVPVLAVTAGDPCGIGPEILLKVLGDLPRPTRHHLIIVGDLRVFLKAASRLHLPVPRWAVIGQADAMGGSRCSLLFVDVCRTGDFVPGRSSAEAGRAALAYLDCAVGLWRAGRIQGVVTAPVTKWAIERSKPSFVGQTEYLSQTMGTPHVAMMFVSPQLKVVLLTRHLPIRDVARRVDQRLIRHTIELAVEALRRHFHIRRPRVAVCGLNPHAGEGGLFGREERRILLPVLTRLRRRGMRLEGPLASDGLFPCAHRYDVVVCWYHDQALIPFKLVARNDGCQLSVGLPIVRTSPDHGSALDIAGKGIAHPGSMRYALKLAAALVR